MTSIGGRSGLLTAAHCFFRLDDNNAGVIGPVLRDVVIQMGNGMLVREVWVTPGFYACASSHKVFGECLRSGPTIGDSVQADLAFVPMATPTDVDPWTAGVPLGSRASILRGVQRPRPLMWTSLYLPGERQSLIEVATHAEGAQLSFTDSGSAAIPGDDAASLGSHLPRIGWVVSGRVSTAQDTIWLQPVTAEIIRALKIDAFTGRPHP